MEFATRPRAQDYGGDPRITALLDQRARLRLPGHQPRRLQGLARDRDAGDPLLGDVAAQRRQQAQELRGRHADEAGRPCTKRGRRPQPQLRRATGAATARRQRSTHDDLPRAGAVVGARGAGGPRVLPAPADHELPDDPQRRGARAAAARVQGARAWRPTRTRLKALGDAMGGGDRLLVGVRLPALRGDRRDRGLELRRPGRVRLHDRARRGNGDSRARTRRTSSTSTSGRPARQPPAGRARGAPAGRRAGRPTRGDHAIADRQRAAGRVAAPAQGLHRRRRARSATVDGRQFTDSGQGDLRQLVPDGLAPILIDDFLDTTLTVPGVGRLRVARRTRRRGRSRRKAGGTEAWTLTCEAPGGPRSSPSKELVHRDPRPAGSTVEPGLRGGPAQPGAPRPSRAPSRRSDGQLPGTTLGARSPADPRAARAGRPAPRRGARAASASGRSRAGARCGSGCASQGGTLRSLVGGAARRRSPGAG